MGENKAISAVFFSPPLCCGCWLRHASCESQSGLSALLPAATCSLLHSCPVLQVLGYEVEHVDGPSSRGTTRRLFGCPGTAADDEFWACIPGDSPPAKAIPDSMVNVEYWYVKLLITQHVIILTLNLCTGARQLVLTPLRACMCSCAGCQTS